MVIISACCFAVGIVVGTSGMSIKVQMFQNIAKQINTFRPYIGVVVSNVGEESRNYGVPQGAAVKVMAEDV